MLAVGSRTYGATASYSLALPLAATVQAQTRTAIVYSDRGLLRVGYQLRGALGESRVSPSQLTVQMDLTFSDGGTASFSCSLPSQSSGVGE